MLFFNGVMGLFLLGLWIFCIIDVITTPAGGCRHLPKLAWFFIVVIFPDLGSIAWLVAGRNWNRQPANLPHKAGLGRRPSAPSRGRNPDDDEEFQAQLRVRVEEQRRRAREAQQGDDRPPAA